MESLFANYASSDDEEEQQQQISTKSYSNLCEPTSISRETPKLSSSLFSSLPQPKSSSSIFSLPPPKSHHPNPQTPSNPSSSEPNPEPTKPSSSFSSLPPPKSSLPNPLALTNPSASGSNPKRVVQFKPPINQSLLSRDDDEDEDQDEKEKERKPTKEFKSSEPVSSLKSFFSNLPAPKNSLGSGTPSLGSGRRSIVEAEIPTSNFDGFKKENETGTSGDLGSHEGNWVDGSSAAKVGAVDGSSESAFTGTESANWLPGNNSYENYAYESYGNYAGYETYGTYEDGTYGTSEGNQADTSTTMTAAWPTQEMSGAAENMVRIPGKRGRNDVPADIVEVKQDELMKNRPREDQVKLTGIAFGPSYQD
ncbi:probable serine/threonine-protein kinase samkC [Macadamia integrifolia]|uniref:probable serine/threonine-protein kinase samkC n=1 Tax=Macadamia integrifolia TaxID=60698 RepID=UPI001C500F14|nr:probable serine/threonine-protein kinase samkC [Macadamia integrifolia]